MNNSGVLPYDTDDTKDSPMPPPDVTMELLDYRISKVEENQARFIAATEAIIILGATIEATKGALDKITKLVDAIERRATASEKLIPLELDRRLRLLEENVPKTRMIEGLIWVGVTSLISMTLMGFYGMYTDYMRSAEQQEQVQLK